MLNNQEYSAPVLIMDLGMQYATSTSKVKERYGLYKCHCGVEFRQMSKSIINGDTKSCGCLRHKLSSHPLWGVRKNMITRCYNKNYRKFEHYGGRGIIVCDEWKNNFVSFYEWAINNGYEFGLSIDRINVDGNYEPSNCRFTTQTIQTRNTQRIRPSNTSGYRGVTFRKSSNKWVSQISVSYKKISLGYYDTAIEAAIAYDTYVIENNLEHTINGVLPN